jgi:hypothetical protein
MEEQELINPKQIVKNLGIETDGEIEGELEEDSEIVSVDFSLEEFYKEISESVNIDYKIVCKVMDSFLDLQLKKFKLK